MPKYKESTIKELKVLAAVGAKARYEQLKDEMANLFRQFPGLDASRSNTQKATWNKRHKRQAALGVGKTARKRAKRKTKTT